MKHLFAILLYTTLGLVDPTKIARINEYKEEAKDAYLASDYSTAIEKYKELVYTEGVEDPAVLLNLAHAYYKGEQKESAKPLYEQLSRSEDKLIKAAAYHQLGMMAIENAEKPDLDRAISNFKEALKADPTNEATRQNYEIVKKMKEQQEQQQNQDDQNKDQNQDQQNKDQEQNKDQQNQDQKDQENKENSDQNKEDQESEEEKKDSEKDKQDSDKSDEEKGAEEQEKQDQEGKESESDKQQEPQQSEEEKQEQERQQRMQQQQQRMQEIQMSEEQANMILEALKNKEQQYYQQLKRKSDKPKNSDRPDW